MEYEVSVTNTFEATSGEDAVWQMVEWLQEAASQTAYRVRGGADTELAGEVSIYDAGDIVR